MAQTTISIRMDGELKQSFERLCRDIGMNVSTAFTIFAKQSVRENRLPVSLSVDPFYSEENMEELIRRAKDPNPKFIVKTMEELEAMEDE